MWLGGYSTGCNLVLDYADANPGRTKGFVLFSPAVEVRPPFAWAASFVSNFRDWLVTPESRPNGRAQSVPVLRGADEGLCGLPRHDGAGGRRA